MVFRKTLNYDFISIELIFILFWSYYINIYFFSVKFFLLKLSTVFINFCIFSYYTIKCKKCHAEI